MPTITSAKKRMRQSEKRRAHNRVQRAAVRTALKKVRNAPSAEAAQAAFRAAERLLDRAARKGQMAKNTAARHKRRLSQLVRKKS